MSQTNTELASVPQNAAQHTEAAAGELRIVTGKAITPESFQQELAAIRGGYSRNARRVAQGWGHSGYLLELWPRDASRLGGDPLLMTTDSLPNETRRADWLAQFSFSYDPARYAFKPPERLRGRARFRAFLQSLRTEQTKQVPFRPLRHSGPCGRADHLDDEGQGGGEAPQEDESEGQ